jgi:hypothetical protein
MPTFFDWIRKQALVFKVLITLALAFEIAVAIYYVVTAW